MGKVILIGAPQARFEILKAGWYKDAIYLLSIVQTHNGVASMWSVHPHEYGDTNQVTLNMLKDKYQTAHDRQIHNMILQEKLYEPVDPQAGTVMDITKKQLEEMGVKH